MKKFDTSLYLITDSTGFTEEEFLRRTEAALQGGVTLLQLREKDKTTRRRTKNSFSGGIFFCEVSNLRFEVKL